VDAVADLLACRRTTETGQVLTLLAETTEYTMRNRQTLLTVFAGVFSLIVVIGALVGPKATRPTVMGVAVAVSRDLDEGTRLTDEMLVVSTFPESHLPIGVFKDRSELIGRILRNPVQKNQLLYPTILVEGDAPQILQAKIPEGKRAYTISLNSASAGLAGFAVPGSRVDVLSHPDNPRGEAARVSEPVVENVVILAVDGAMDADDVSSNPKTMTLLMTPEESAIIDAAQSRGPLRLALRNGDDQEVRQPEKLPASPAAIPAETPDRQIQNINRRPSEFSVLVMRGPTTAATSVRKSRFSNLNMTIEAGSSRGNPAR